MIDHPYRTVQSLEEFKAILNKVCNQIVGLSVDDLPDFCWADSYHAEMTRREAYEICNDIMQEQLAEMADE